MINYSDVKLRRMFCKDNGIPIAIYDSPFFESRLELFEKYFSAKTLWEKFKAESAKYDSVGELLDRRDTIMNQAIEAIKSTDAYQEFNTMDIGEIFKIEVPEKYVCDKVYNDTNLGKDLLSIDIRKSNFSCLRAYNSEIVGSADTYEDFIRQFTDDEIFINSKYLRQIIFGNLNPKRQQKYSKYLTSKILKYLNDNFDYDIYDMIRLFQTDEIVLDMSSISTDDIDLVVSMASKYASEVLGIDVKCTLFNMIKVCGINGYVKEGHVIVLDSPEYLPMTEFKCIDSKFMPMVLRAMDGQEVTEDDETFVCDGNIIARMLSYPNIFIS